MDSQLFQLLVSTTRFSDRTKAIVNEVLVRGRSRNEVANEYNVSRQFVSVRVQRVLELKKSFLENANKLNIFLVNKDTESDD